MDLTHHPSKTAQQVWPLGHRVFGAFSVHLEARARRQQPLPRRHLGHHGAARAERAGQRMAPQRQMQRGFPGVRPGRGLHHVSGDAVGLQVGHQQPDIVRHRFHTHKALRHAVAKHPQRGQPHVGTHVHHKLHRRGHAVGLVHKNLQHHQQGFTRGGQRCVDDAVLHPQPDLPGRVIQRQRLVMHRRQQQRAGGRVCRQGLHRAAALHGQVHPLHGQRADAVLDVTRLHARQPGQEVHFTGGPGVLLGHHGGHVGTVLRRHIGQQARRNVMPLHRVVHVGPFSPCPWSPSCRHAT